MDKIPTLFVRDEIDRQYVTFSVTPGLEWVALEGIPTRKWDGTCVMFDGSEWWARSEVKPGKDAPDDFLELSEDETTGKRIGWVRAETSGFSRYLNEAIRERGGRVAPGTYELIGPKINGNPEGMLFHGLARHGEYLVSHVPDPDFDVPFDVAILPGTHPLVLTSEGLTDTLDLIAYASDQGWEGIVWYHPETGERAKLKVKDIRR